MTLRLTIKNEDLNGRSASVTEETFAIGQPSPMQIQQSRLAAGESREFYVHASKRLIVSEDPDSLR